MVVLDSAGDTDMTNTNAHARAGQGRKWVRDSLRLSIYASHGWRCFFCNRQCEPNLGNSASNQATLDHIVPRSVASDNSHFNIVLACRRCNTSMKDIPKTRAILDRALAFARARTLKPLRKRANDIIKTTSNWRQACLVSHADTMQ